MEFVHVSQVCCVSAGHMYNPLRSYWLFSSLMAWGKKLSGKSADSGLYASVPPTTRQQREQTVAWVGGVLYDVLS